MNEQTDEAQRYVKKKLKNSSGKYCACSIWWLRLLEGLVFIILIGSIFIFAGLNFQGCTKSDADIKSADLNYWGNVIAFLPDTIGGFIGIIVGFFFEATFFKINKDRQHRKTLIKLLNEELSTIQNELTAELSENDILTKIISIPITEQVVKSVEESSILDINKKNQEDYNPLDLLYSIFAQYNYLNIARENKKLFAKKLNKERGLTEIEIRYDDLLKYLDEFLIIIEKDREEQRNNKNA